MNKNNEQKSSFHRKYATRCHRSSNRKYVPVMEEKKQSIHLAWLCISGELPIMIIQDSPMHLTSFAYFSDIRACNRLCILATHYVCEGVFD